jgi:hypothetical protein
LDLEALRKIRNTNPRDSAIKKSGRMSLPKVLFANAQTCCIKEAEIIIYIPKKRLGLFSFIVNNDTTRLLYSQTL